MKTAIFVAVAFAAFTGISLLAQQANGSTQPSASANAVGTQAAVGFGDAAQSHEWEMSSVSGELEGKLDSKSAKVGDRVVLKTTEKVLTSDGTMIPRARAWWAT